MPSPSSRITTERFPFLGGAILTPMFFACELIELSTISAIAASKEYPMLRIDSIRELAGGERFITSNFSFF
jgi:hypothetical protein